MQEKLNFESKESAKTSIVNLSLMVKSAAARDYPLADYYKIESARFGAKAVIERILADLLTSKKEKLPV